MVVVNASSRARRSCGSPADGGGGAGTSRSSCGAVCLLVDDEAGVEGVEADQGVQVDDAAGLHLGDLGERGPRPVGLEGLVDAGRVRRHSSVT